MRDQTVDAGLCLYTYLYQFDLNEQVLLCSVAHLRRARTITLRD